MLANYTLKSFKGTSVCDMMAILKFNMVATRVRFIVESLLKTILQGSLQVYFRAVGGGGTRTTHFLEWGYRTPTFHTHGRK